jgi:hypothetical protein
VCSVRHGKIRGDGVSTSASLADLGDDGLGLFRAAAVMHQNLRAHSGKGQRTGAADPTRGASDESGLS